jgi:tetratricopeptide (TPR) repeat protein
VDNARNIVDAYYSLKKDREGREMLDRLAFNGWMEKGVNYHELGQCQEAIECYNAALEINPNDDDALFLKSLAVAEVGDSISNGNSNPI